MNLSTLLTTLAFVTATEAKLGGTPSFADQVSFLEKHAVGGQPDYCYPQYEPEDYGCYKEGYPKCCYKSKGNCPNDVKNKPGCECLPGSCGGSGGDTKGDRCTQNDGTCKGSTFCQTTEGTCAGEGRCEEMTISCDRSSKQVCGCNGATYDNECAAFGVGVSVDYDRACGSAPVTTPAPTPAPTDFNYFPGGYPVCKRSCRNNNDCRGQGGVFNPCYTCGQYQGTLMYRKCYKVEPAAETPAPTPAPTDFNYFPGGYPVCKRSCRNNNDCRGQGGVYNPCFTCGRYSGSIMYQKCYETEGTIVE